MKLKPLLALATLSAASGLAAAESPAKYSTPEEFRLSGVSLVEGRYKGESALEIKMPSSSYQDQGRERLLDRDFMAWLPMDFTDGTIEVDVASDLASDAPDYARGFIGVSFRIDAQSRFESIYLRPTNSQADDQERRNHSVQYAGYPDFRFDQLRKESPEQYETYADLELGRWIHMKVVVEGAKARLYLDHAAKPAFLVNDLKYGAGQHGGIGIWIESGTVAHFKNLKVTHGNSL
ncbi:hypothetical protein CFII64_13298 [Pseudomonas sp. CFII64]|uniref:hypothetical protein n=1 Tax=Pseudomonas sp. CFII64 TaxID=911242 RepID=UPI0003579C27|nr:hypothetical protein [Pseudomonas sp. CFII64]EPJ84696.1 hypothetical protein CFII64_13298 [Pseudomonas sp. CFII64]